MIEPAQIFSVPIYRSSFVIHEENRQAVIEKIKSHSTFNQNSPIGSVTNYDIGKQIIDEEELIEIKNFIKEATQQAHRYTGFDGEIDFLDSWFSITTKYGYHEAHTHPGSLWSAVYYINASSSDAPICFLNRNILDAGWTANLSYLQNDVNSSQVSVAPETGLLLIFPSYLLHKVDQQKTDNERIMIALNLGVKGVHTKV
jgi:uncharacterized protein (TIGR02466 family)